MRKNIFLLSTIFSLLFSCNEPSRSDEQGDITDTSAAVESDTLRSPEQLPATNEKSVEEIASFLDSLYGLKAPQKVSLETDQKKMKKPGEGLGPGLLDLTEVENYYSRFPFEFLVFDDSLAAKKQFKRIINAGFYDHQENSKTDSLDYENLFPKGGSTYILYGKMIIFHFRMCSYNEKIEKPREDRLLDYLFDSRPTDEIYFIRVRCGWVSTEVMPNIDNQTE